jgi:hypothetical protein
MLRLEIYGNTTGVRSSRTADTAATVQALITAAAAETGADRPTLETAVKRPCGTPLRRADRPGAYGRPPAPAERVRR